MVGGELGEVVGSWCLMGTKFQFEKGDSPGDGQW
jgi:hypothetical protein